MQAPLRSTLRRLDSGELLAWLPRIIELREFAWTRTGSVPQFVADLGRWSDDHDEHAAHWVLAQGAELYASARLCVHETAVDLPDATQFEQFSNSFQTPIAAFSRLVVHESVSHRHIPSRFDSVRLAHALELGCRSAAAITHVQSRLDDLVALGFVRLGVAKPATLPHTTSLVLGKRL